MESWPGPWECQGECVHQCVCNALYNVCVYNTLCLCVCVCVRPTVRSLLTPQIFQLSRERHQVMFVYVGTTSELRVTPLYLSPPHTHTHTYIHKDPQQHTLKHCDFWPVPRETSHLLPRRWLSTHTSSLLSKMFFLRSEVKHQSVHIFITDSS